MRWLVCVVALVLIGAGMALGAWLGRREDRRPATAAVALALLALALHASLTPARELAWFPDGGLYHRVRSWWVIPLAMIPLGAGTAVMSTPFARKGLGVFAALVLLSAARPVVLTAAFDPSTVNGRVAPSGVCQQTTDYTCGAAAASMLLHACGVEASEAEMALLCGTNALTGTDVYSVAVGVRQKLAGTGREVRVVPCDWEGLVARREPALATIRWGFLIDHWVMIREAHPGAVVVLDPVEGVRTLSRAEFLGIWRGWVVSADRPPAAGPEAVAPVASR